MHGVGFGCGHEFDAVYEKLDKTKLSANAKSIKHITAETICLLCYTGLVNDTGDESPMSIITTPSEQIIIVDQSIDEASDGGTLVRPRGGDETLPKKRPNSVAETSKSKKKQRADGEPMKHREFSIQEKLDILEKLRTKRLTVDIICRQHGCSKSSVKRWKKNEADWKAELTKHMGGKSKRLNVHDGLKRVKDGLHEFYDLNHSMPKDLKLPITREYYYIILYNLSPPPDKLLNLAFPLLATENRGYSLDNGHKN